MQTTDSMASEERSEVGGTFAAPHAGSSPRWAYVAVALIMLLIAGIRFRLREMPQFVTVRGGAYFFLPSLSGLRYIAGIMKD